MSRPFKVNPSLFIRQANPFSYWQSLLNFLSEGYNGVFVGVAEVHRPAVVGLHQLDQPGHQVTHVLEGPGNRTG